MLAVTVPGLKLSYSSVLIIFTFVIQLKSCKCHENAVIVWHCYLPAAIGDYLGLRRFDNSF